VDKIDAPIVTIQSELKRHSWDTFAMKVELGGRKVIVPGCPRCLKLINTNTKFVEHFADDTIPVLFVRLRKKSSTVDGPLQPK
jgi:hypothetical protein